MALLKAARQVKGMAPPEIEEVWGSTLYHIDDLPYNPREHLPHVYGRFRTKGAGVKVRSLLDAPRKGELPFPEEESKLIDAAGTWTPSLIDL